jgi:hypothetical protein
MIYPSFVAIIILISNMFIVARFFCLYLSVIAGFIQAATVENRDLGSTVINALKTATTCAGCEVCPVARHFLSFSYVEYLSEHSFAEGDGQWELVYKVD